MSSKFLMVLTAACIAFAPAAMAESQTGPGASGSPDAAKTTVKSSKSNGSEIQGQTGGQTGRMGGGGGVRGGGGQAGRMGGGGGKPPDPAKAINLNSSRSNIY